MVEGHVITFATLPLGAELLNHEETYTIEVENIMSLYTYSKSSSVIVISEQVPSV